MASVTLTLSAILSILVGLLILRYPQLLNYFVSIWFILHGILQIVGGYFSI